QREDSRPQRGRRMGVCERARLVERECLSHVRASRCAWVRSVGVGRGAGGFGRGCKKRMAGTETNINRRERKATRRSRPRTARLRVKGSGVDLERNRRAPAGGA